jgi:competence protein ComEC
MKDRAILTGIFSFVGGVLLSSFVFIPPLVTIFIILVGVAVLVAEKVWVSHVKMEVALLAVAIIFFGVGCLRYSIKDFHEARLPGSEGVVVSEPEQRENATRFVFKSDNGEKVLVSTGLYAEVEYGDRVKVAGELEKPGIIESESGRSFDYGKFLAKDDIYYTLSFAEVEIFGEREGHPLKAALLKVKQSFLAKVKETFSEPYASLLSGLLLAGKDAMPKDLMEEFRRAGIVHIVVLSGYNITIIAEFIRKVFEKIFILSRATAIPALASGASILSILIFVLMTGAEATVVRAAIMVLTVVVAKMLGRKYSAPRALLLAGFIMLLENPKILAFDPSFQLSFLATLALIYVVPILEKYLSFMPEKLGLKTIVATTVGTQIAVLPLLIYSVGEISLVSLPANILALLIVPYSMLLGFVSVSLAYASSLLALPFAYITHILLSWILGVSGFFGHMKFASVGVVKFSFIFVILAYLLLNILVWRERSFPRKSAS